MVLFQKKGIWDSGKVQHISITDIAPSPHQPRSEFDDASLLALAASIQEIGILQPLSVRRVDGSWQLVAGERRLRAATLAGLTHVPCLAISTDSQTASLLTMMENLQRKDLNFLEEARGLAIIIQRFHLSQDQLAQRLGRSQSSVANKLRLLKLPEDILLALCQGGCTERHARALLRLSNEDQLHSVTQAILQDKLTVAQTEALVESILSPPPPTPHRRLRFIPKDIRIFMNTINRSLKVMQTAGLNARCFQEDLDGEFVVTIRIPKALQ